MPDVTWNWPGGRCNAPNGTLIWREPDKLPGAARRLGIGVVDSVNKCLDVLIEIDSDNRAEPSVMDRVRKMLGLKPAAKTTTAVSP